MPIASGKKSALRIWNNPHIVAAVIYVVLTLVIFRHVIEAISTGYGNPDNDSDAYLWLNWLNIYAQANGVMFENSNLVGFPFGFSLQDSPFGQFLLDIHALIYHMIDGEDWRDMLFVMNVVKLSTYPLSAMSAYGLAYYLTRNSFSALVAGLIFSFSYAHILEASGAMSYVHLETMPLYFLTLIIFARGGGFWSMTASALLALITFKINAYYGFFLVLLSLPVIVFYNEGGSFKKLLRTSLLYFSFVGICVVATNLDFFLQNLYMLSESTRLQAGRNANILNSLNSPLTYFANTTSSALYSFGYSGNGDRFLGYLPIVLFLAAPIFSASVRRSREYLLFAVLLLSVIVLASYNPLFYVVNRLYFAIFGMFRGVGYMGVLASLFVAVACAVCIEIIARSHFVSALIGKAWVQKLQPTLLIIAAVVIVAENLNLNQAFYRITRIDRLEQLYQPIIDDEDIHALINYPYELHDLGAGPPRLFQYAAQVAHQKPMVNGIQADHQNFALKQIVLNPANEGAIEALASMGVNAIVVYNQLIDGAFDLEAMKSDPRLTYVGRFIAPFDRGLEGPIFSLSNKSRDISLFKIKGANTEITKNMNTLQLLPADGGAAMQVDEVAPYKYELDVVTALDAFQLRLNVPYANDWLLLDCSYSILDILRGKIPALGVSEVAFPFWNQWNVNVDETKQAVAQECLAQKNDGTHYMLTILNRKQFIYGLLHSISNTVMAMLAMLLLVAAGGEFLRNKRAKVDGTLTSLPVS
ncbi:MAG: hypothetical protein RQ899_01740 [Pseudomonadales bacterium]|nr:hypothetical protein [Pseudomonadales bacterium]